MRAAAPNLGAKVEVTRRSPYPRASQFIRDDAVVTISTATERLDVLAGPGRDTLRAVGLAGAPLVEINLMGEAAGDVPDEGPG